VSGEGKRQVGGQDTPETDAKIYKGIGKRGKAPFVWLGEEVAGSRKTRSNHSRTADNWDFPSGKDLGKGGEEAVI